jgi:sodium transport system ATP-binding protein
MIEAHGLTKWFRDRRRGRVEALSGVSFRCRPGAVFGLLGPNGAGKTTALRILATALRPTSGGATVAGADIAREGASVRARIGFLSAATGLYPRLTPREILRTFGALYGMEGARLEERLAEMARVFALGEFLDRPCDKLSTGMKQRVGVARTVLHDPPVLILDEPTAGLDVLSSRTIVDFVRSERERGKTILFSTHIMSEVERLCDDLGVLHRGRLVFSGTLAEFPRSGGEALEEAFLRFLTEEER